MANHKAITQIYHTCQQRLLHLVEACRPADPAQAPWSKRFKQWFTKSNNKDFKP